ncbi:tyrosine-type recombinase/integrase [Pantoea sp. A4]|uniref:tyrosine-type recombinase/integrase n=1 Tax=Pantoea sp. A4 TaxID=1225184 RepID=UPI000369CE0C|nr:site-specific integrase [Pantoea sp. A4]
MSKEVYPTGVENHGGSLRIWFKYRDQRVRENLGVPDTAKNRRVAGELRSSVCFSIKMGNFDYAAQFPSSPNLKKFGLDNKDLSVEELSEKWLAMKQLEISANAHYRYCSVVKNMLPRLGARRSISSITREELLNIRKDLLTGHQVIRTHRPNPKEGRSVYTVNYYMITMNVMFQFAVDNGYISESPFSNLKPLKKAKAEPDPISQEEYTRLIASCLNRQTKNLFTFAFYSGVRHGELIALAWEDVDLKAGTLTVRRNLTTLGDFTLPKTDAGTDRVIHLVSPALEALRDQAELTRLGKQHLKVIKLREYGRTTTHPCTFIFSPLLNKPGTTAGEHYAPGTLRNLWESVIKRAGIRYRKAYQTRHTFACWMLSAGANPTFIASQMGHSSAQMLYSVYGGWMLENSAGQVEIINRNLSSNAPYMPHRKKA